MRTPVSTYRLQITEDFDLHAAARVLPYLHDLGVDWVYLSPLLAAESHSNHGYDVSDHGRIDAARGGVSGLSAVSAEAHRLGMGVLVDIVPNHVGVAQGERQRVVVVGADPRPGLGVRRGVRHRLGGGWRTDPHPGGRRRRPRSRTARSTHLVVEAGQLLYHDHAFPLAPGSADDMDERSGSPPQDVHARQHYELVSWRTADAGLNYRRFFAVNSLAAIRVEDREWFDRSHDEIGRWFSEGMVDGLRVDHPDGLRDPEGYLRDLAELTGDAYVLVEKILEPGEELPARLADRRHHRLRRDGAHRPGAHRPGRGRGRWARSTSGCAAARSTGPDGARQQARRRRRDPPLGGAAHRPRAAGARSPTPRPTPRTRSAS